MENLSITSSNKKDIYKEIIPQIKAIVFGETDLIANWANISAILKEAFNFWWVGFYLVKENQLVLGPFQGPLACTRINYGKGVCGTSWKEQKVIIVPNVDEFPGHIACSSLSKSEIVLPICINNIIIGVLDIDSSSINTFDNIDAEYLSQIVEIIENL